MSPDGVDASGSGADSRRTPVAEDVLAVVESLLSDLGQRSRVPLVLDTDLASAGGLDSLAFVELHDRFERAFDVRLSDSVLATALTPRDWLEALRGASSEVVSGKPAMVFLRAEEPSSDGSASGGWPSDTTSIPDALWWHTSAHGDQETLRILGEDGVEESLSYRALATEALGVAEELRSLGLRSGERVALILPTSREYFTIFLGVLIAGAVPMPLYPPNPRSALEAHLRRIAGVLRRGDAAMLVCDVRVRAAARVISLGLPSLRRIVTPPEISARAPRGDTAAEIDPDTEALVQFTSGSTGDPKGVVLTHRQLIANIAAMGQGAAVGPQDRFVSWLPVYHDMGLIGAWLAPLVLGLPLTVFSPLTFLARPVRWLEAISKDEGTLSAAPNFAYAACAERISDDELEGLDLSSWRLAFNGSEPVTEPVIARFVERLSRFGFREEAMCPAYGLAELGVGAAFSPLGRVPKVEVVDRVALEQSGRAVAVAPGASSRSIVSCGVALPGYHIRVVDASGTPLPDGREGEVECQGPSATRCYAGSEEASLDLWREGWLRTGDLGYLDRGELFLTGRRKDLVIRAGRNLHPEELENVIAARLDLEPSGVAVFGSRDERRGTESLVVALEARPSADVPGDLPARVNEALVSSVGVGADRVIVLGPGDLPRTANGKVRRAATREAFEQGTLGAPAASRTVAIARLVWGAREELVRRLTRRALELAGGLYAWATVAIVGSVLVVALELARTRRARWKLARGAARLLSSLNKIRCEIDRPLPGEKPIVMVANHLSFLDGALFVLVSPEPFAFVASADIASLAVIGHLLERLGCTFIPRDAVERSGESLEKLEAILRAGERLLVFPEGAISVSGELRSFRLGAFLAAARTGTSVVPIGIAGAERVLPVHRYLVRPGVVRLSVGASLRATSEDLAAAAELRDAAYSSVKLRMADARR